MMQEPFEKQRMLSRVLGIGVILLSMLCVLAWGEGAGQKSMPKKGGAVSMAALLADPGRYDAAQVVVRGFLVNDGTTPLLFFNSESIQHNIGKNAVRLDLGELKEAEARRLAAAGRTPCCTLKGTVSADDGGVNGLGACTLIGTAVHNVDY
jgi:hypothetical protein